MNEQIYGYISSIVTGLVTNGIQGIFDYITKENLQDRITNVIETAQEIYEKEYQCSNSSLFIWQKNIEFYTQWLMEGFLPRKDVFPPVQYGEKADSIVTPEEVDFREPVTKECDRTETDSGTICFNSLITVSILPALCEFCNNPLKFG